MAETKPDHSNGAGSHSTRETLGLLIMLAVSLAIVVIFVRPAPDRGESGTLRLAGPLADTNLKALDTGPPAYPFAELSSWLPNVHSIRLRAEVRFECGPDTIARNLREIKNQYPDLKDPDPLV